MQRRGWRTRNGRWRWPLLALGLALAAIAVRLDRAPVRSRDVIQGPLTGVARVIDGDSIMIAGAEIRLQGIDAPEGRQTCRRDGRPWDCGEAARRSLERLIGGSQVTCSGMESDKHGRLLGRCEARGASLNRGMVAEGMAVSSGGDFAREEAIAKAAGHGLWGSEFERPSAWRHERGMGR